MIQPQVDAYLLLALPVSTSGVMHSFKHIHSCHLIAFSCRGLFEPSAMCSARCGMGLLRRASAFLRYPGVMSCDISNGAGKLWMDH